MAVLVVLAVLAAGCAPSGPPSLSAGRIRVVAAENQYGDVAAQIGGDYVQVRSVMSNPNTDPHSYEVNASLARSIDSAAVIVQNGLGYDSFMDTIESATGRPGRRIIDVQKLLHVPSSTPNPHLWYDPRTMPAVAAELAAEFSAVEPQHASYFAANASRFDASLQPWLAATARLRTDHPGDAVAATEPVADYLLQSAGLTNVTPPSFLLAVMNGVDPAPQDLTSVGELISHHRIRALIYNRQVTDSVTAAFLSRARRAGIPLVGVYETMPTPGYDYQRWMLAETEAIDRAVSSGISTGTL
ncbi:MAG TPA: zinc ABC transporter substrate-binding protein [Acidimicrobiales bacterium]|nr:zinc ABC transporter substrate-binding protein [Acidimicrobiales bacterium]